jgi:Spy/CpxP family protein refolding chaperone
MKEIRSATQKEMIDLRADMQKKRIDLKEIHSADAPDRPAFERLTRGIADLQVKQKLLLFDSREKVMAKLTAEQKEKFKELKEHRPMMQGKGMKGNMRGNSHRDRDSR